MKNEKKNDFAIVIHGGAGTLLKGKYTDQEIEEHENILKEALLAGQHILSTGGSSLDAAQQAVVVLENSPLFNAGKGAVFNEDGFHELDASIMEGKDLQVGGITGSTKVKNPILAARMVLEKSPHCLLAAGGADRFAEQHGLEMVDQEYFFTQKRWEQWHMAQSTKTVQLDHSDFSPHGTVGAVALDQQGNLSSATSTGGLTNKSFGRVSDSAIIGAGTYANNKTCAISTTGKGDYFIRNMTAGDISLMMEYKKLSLHEACQLALDKVEKQGGEGGVIGLDAQGNAVMMMNTPGMFRGLLRENGEMKVEIF